jgi:hypothetical protein
VIARPPIEANNPLRGGQANSDSPCNAAAISRIHRRFQPQKRAGTLTDRPRRNYAAFDQNGAISIRGKYGPFQPYRVAKVFSLGSKKA